MQLLFGSLDEDTEKLEQKGWAKAGADLMKERFQLHLQREIGSPEKELIISGEGLCKLTYAEVAAMARMLLGHASDVKVLAYVREPTGFMASAFQQGLKGKLATFTFPQPQYRDRFEKYIDAFGQQNVEFRSFDDVTHTGRSIVADFAGWVGIVPEHVKEVRVNDSLSVAAVAVLLGLNQKSRLWHRDRSFVVIKAGIIETLRLTLPVATYGKFRFAAAAAQAEIKVEDVEWMRQVSGLSRFSPPTTSEDESGIRTLDQLVSLAWSVRPEIARLIEGDGLTANETDDTASLLEQLLRHRMSSGGHQVKP